MEETKKAATKPRKPRTTKTAAARSAVADLPVNDAPSSAAPKRRKPKSDIPQSEKKNLYIASDEAKETVSAAPITTGIGGKMIAVCGTPNSGKTSVALKLAQEIYSSKNKTVLYISSDLSTPAMGYIFPNGKDADLYSIGTVLDKTDILREDTVKQTVCVKAMANFGFLGYKLGENKYSYARPTEDKVEALFRAARAIAAYIIVDCTNDADDLISSMAFSASDVALQVVTPTVKCMAYYASNEVPYHTDKLIIMNVCDNDLYLPVDEVKAHFKDVSFVLPYSRELKQQSITGTLSKKLNDRKYHARLSALARRVV